MAKGFELNDTERQRYKDSLKIFLGHIEREPSDNIGFTYLKKERTLVASVECGHCGN